MSITLDYHFMFVGLSWNRTGIIRPTFEGHDIHVIRQDVYEIVICLIPMFPLRLIITINR